MPKGLEPLRISKDDLDAFVGEYSDKVIQAIEDHSAMRNEWIEHWAKYEGIVKEIRDYPHENASNLHIPFLSTHVDALYSRFRNLLLAYNPLVTVKSPRDSDFANNLSSFLEVIIKKKINIKDKFSNFISECVLLGTSIVKIVYGQYYPTIETPDLDDIIVPYNAKDIQSADFVAQIIRYTKKDLMIGAQRDELERDAVETMLKVGPDSIVSNIDGVSFKFEYLSNIGITAKASDTYDVFEIWTNYVTMKENVPVFFRYHLNSKQLLIRPSKNPFQERKFEDKVESPRPFVRFPFMVRKNKFYGIGVGDMIEYLQEEINTLHNQRIDNHTIANTQCLKHKPGVLKKNESVFPGKRFVVKDMNDIEPFSLASHFGMTTYNDESIIRDYAEKRTGVTDYTLGAESSILKSRATASGTLAIMQESNKRFDAIMSEFRNGIEKIYKFIYEYYFINPPDENNFASLQSYGIEGEPLFNFFDDIVNLDEELEFICTASTSAINKETEKQTNLMIFDKMLLYYERIINAINLALSNELPEPAKVFMIETVRSSYVMMKRLLDLFEIQPADQILPFSGFFEALSQGQDVTESETEDQVLNKGQSESSSGDLLEGIIQ